MENALSPDSLRNLLKVQLMEDGCWTFHFRYKSRLSFRRDFYWRESHIF